MKNIKQLLFAGTLLTAFSATSALAFASQLIDGRQVQANARAPHAMSLAHATFAADARSDGSHSGSNFLAMGTKQPDPFTDGTRSVTDKRDPFTDGARNLVNGSDAQILAAGPRKSDPYTDGGNEATGPRDPFTDGRHA
ncbi:hypothetical protein EPIRMAN_GEN20615_12300 [Ralstonia mannitolilytica]|uniref:hypothetical protein n=1 Tax=Ralstonia mannitolilytica TaxID=105219 RepID=UPI0007B039D3|nr:hypothetical protein [Ralstonia mannitolilytica]MBU9580853.1 hypothetical protein [Ralstonia mannitolilytica]CAJ0687009.1 hypothetical protein R82526_02909 [Ralstonia mannitolilytica]CAJ0804553.1 hypothetical protein R77555_04143 [Ralstonia mannitolilytica]